MPRIIHVNQDEPMTLLECQEFVGGIIQIVTLPEGDQMIINEEGKLLGMPRNDRATEIAYRARAIFSGDYIAGNAMILYGDARLP